LESVPETDEDMLEKLAFVLDTFHPVDLLNVALHYHSRDINVAWDTLQCLV
jgi:hypothetical protein